MRAQPSAQVWGSRDCADGESSLGASALVAWLFGAVEFHFDTEAQLFWISTEDEDGTERVIAKSAAAQNGSFA